MGKSLRAVFGGQVFRPEQPLDLKANTTGKFYFEPDESAVQAGEHFGFIQAALDVQLDAPPDFSEHHDDYLHRGKPWR